MNNTASSSDPRFLSSQKTYFPLPHLPSNHNITSQMPNKFVYINQNSCNTGRTILINPNFRKNVHINPHFHNSVPAIKNSTIHVNPSILKPKEIELIPKVNRTVVATRTKLIRVPESTKIIKTPLKKRRISIHTKYKIIRSSDSNDNVKTPDSVRKLYYLRNKQLNNNRSLKLSPLRKNQWKSTIFNRSLISSSLRAKNVSIKSNHSSAQFVSINGILYKKSPNFLKKTTSAVNKSDKIIRKKEKIITIRGQKYEMDCNHRTLKLLPATGNKLNLSRIYIGGVSFKRKSLNVFVKTETNKKRLILSQARQKSINTLSNRLKKCNMPCPFYRKFGRCKGKDNGTCIRVHNPNQIALCPKFLQGACVDEKCPLSHKVSLEKMPTCKFFLEGLCCKEDCQYLHVKVNKKAEICKDFIEGFCKNVKECNKRHEYLCPDFEKFGKCLKKKCSYQHGNKVRECKLSRKVVSKLQSTSNQKPKKDVAENIRYYDGLVLEEFDNLGQSDSNVVQRPKLGVLPSFIPLLNDTN